MADFKSPVVATNESVAVHGEARMVQFARGVIAAPSTLALNDTMQFFDLPPNAVIINAYLKSDDLDSNGSPLITLDVGDSGSATRLFSASTVAQAGTAGTESSATAFGFKTAAGARTRIVGTVHAAAATGVAGNIECGVTYSVTDSPTS